jgi:hypothetical protein
MTKYLVLYQSSVSAAEQMAQTDPEQAQAGMELWTAWMNKAAGAIVDFGQPAMPLVTLGPGGARTDPAPPFVGGYGILQAESQADLEQILADHPHYYAPDGRITVLELIDLPGM